MRPMWEARGKGRWRKQPITEWENQKSFASRNQRQDFHYKTAKKLLNKGKHIGHEALNIKGIARTRMAKSTHDAGWGTFLQILEIKAERAGLATIAVNPKGTTQDCSSCGQKTPKTIRDRWHSCPHCGCELDRDHNAAINIKQRAVGHSVLKGAIRSAEILYREMAGFSRVTQKVEYALSSSADDNLVSMQVKPVS